MKKCMLILMLLCLPSLVQAYRVIGDFQNTDAVSDGWAVQGTTTWAPPLGGQGVYPGDTYGATYRDRSRQVHVQGSVQDVIKKNLITSVAYEMKSAETLTMDVTTRNDGALLTPPRPLHLPESILNVKMSFISNAGTWDLGFKTITVTTASKKTSLTWTIPAAIRDGFITGSITTCDLLLVSETGASGGDFWIDNIRLNWPLVSDVAIGNFENEMDSWTLLDGATATYSTIGVTKGTKSAEMIVVGGWKGMIERSVMPFADQLKVADSVTMHVTARNDIGLIPDWWMQFILEIDGEGCGFHQLPNAYGGVPWSLSTFECSWQIPQAVRDSFNAGTTTSCKFKLITNCGSRGGKFWIDNIRIEWPSRAAYNPTPANQSRPGTVTSLSWTNPDGALRNEIYFGSTEPNSADPNQTWRNTLTQIGTIDSPSTQQSINIPESFLPLADDVTYYWIVDGYKGSIIPGEPNLIGDLWQFKPLANTAPVFNLGPDQYHWLGQYGTPGQVSVTLDPTVTDDGKPNPPGALTYNWTKINSMRIDGMSFPVTTKAITLPFTVPGRYELELEVSDNILATKDRVIIYVGTNPCDTYRRTDGAAWFKAGDFDQNCEVEMIDFITIVNNWLDCSDFITNCQ